MNNKLDDIIRQLRDCQPQIDNEDEMTRSIMDSISNLEEEDPQVSNPSKWSKRHIMIFACRLTSVAAIVVLAFVMSNGLSVEQSKVIPTDYRQCIEQYKTDCAIAKDSVGLGETLLCYIKKKQAQHQIIKQLKQSYNESN